LSSYCVPGRSACYGLALVTVMLLLAAVSGLVIALAGPFAGSLA
jgi:hypothetical protein